MEWLQIVILLGSGLAAGYVAGLIGVGGGIIFAPVLLFYYKSIGVSPEVIAKLTVGSSLFCTLIAAIASAWFQYRREAVVPRIALRVGLFSAAAVYLMTRFVTTKPWYDATAFQIVFSVVLLIVVARMVLRRRAARAQTRTQGAAARPGRQGWPLLAGTGATAGMVSSAAGVGGGVVLVPAYNTLLRLPIHLAVGTSSATIVLISFFGVLTYAWMGLGQPVPATAVGYVDFGQALLLAVPAVFSAQAGVWTAHRINQRPLQWSFAVVAFVVAVRLLYDALG